MCLSRGLLPIELPVSRELLSMYKRRGGNSRVLDRDEQILETDDPLFLTNWSEQRVAITNQ